MYKKCLIFAVWAYSVAQASTQAPGVDSRNMEHMRRNARLEQNEAIIHKLADHFPSVEYAQQYIATHVSNKKNKEQESIQELKQDKALEDRIILLSALMVGGACAYFGWELDLPFMTPEVVGGSGLIAALVGLSSLGFRSLDSFLIKKLSLALNSNEKILSIMCQENFNKLFAERKERIAKKEIVLCSLCQSAKHEWFNHSSSKI